MFELLEARPNLNWLRNITRKETESLGHHLNMRKLVDDVNK